MLASYFVVLTPKLFLTRVWPLSLSLATTRKISVDFFSSAYLDVSVRRVPHVTLCIHVTFMSPWGFPIRKSADITAICASPRLIAACHVLRRLPMPRHSPCALSSLNFSSNHYPQIIIKFAWVSQIGYFFSLYCSAPIIKQSDLYIFSQYLKSSCFFVCSICFSPIRFSKYTELTVPSVFSWTLKTLLIFL